MSQKSDRKVAFITGGNRGIGLETARELGALGISVVLGVRDVETGKRALGQLKELGITAEAIRYDATAPETDSAVYAYFEKEYGRLDILVNNAGVLKEGGLAVKTASWVSAQILRETFDVNFFAVVRLTQTLLPLLKKAPAGRIVNLSSILASLTLHSDPTSPIASAKPFAYNASKTALNAFTVHLADELRGSSVKVNSAHPGWVKTELGGPGAPMELADSAKTSVALATLDADGASGGFVHVGATLPW
jgi:NAD(P)-dependent dehydrogenase (short-subunit alcohol dehydrogenase family)